MPLKTGKTPADHSDPRAGGPGVVRGAKRVKRLANVWLPSAAWVVAAAVSPWVARVASPGDPTIISLLVLFVVVGVLGFPLGISLGRRNSLREAALTATSATAVTTAACAVYSLGTGVQLTVGWAASIALVLLLFVLLALSVPTIGFVLGRVLTNRRG
jgi:FtsH-binding integral membrane protein